MEIKLKTLTPIWTGGVDQRCDRIHETGIIGSLRWWYEVLVRGLEGTACDPSAKKVRCPDTNKEPCDRGHHCVVCELFGCTGWARKFRLIVLRGNGKQTKMENRPKQEILLRFIPLRPIQEEEWCLLDGTLRLIAHYGGMGGRTVFKPSDEQNRQNDEHHQDFGLIQYISCEDNWLCNKRLDRLKAYVKRSDWRSALHKHHDDKGEHDFSWASLNNLWCVKRKYLARHDFNKSSFNFAIGRPEPKNQSKNGDSWIAGFKATKSQPASKKVFSFKHPVEGRRTFGFVERKEDYDDIFEKLVALKKRRDPHWSDFDEKVDFLKGKDILKELFDISRGEQE
jgi:CRISPR-associated protein Cmr1